MNEKEGMGPRPLGDYMDEVFKNIRPFQAMKSNKADISEGKIGWIRSYCESKNCQARNFAVFLKTLSESEEIYPKRLHCPLCGEQTAEWWEWEYKAEDDKIESKE